MSGYDALRGALLQAKELALLSCMPSPFHYFTRLLIRELATAHSWPINMVQTELLHSQGMELQAVALGITPTCRGPGGVSAHGYPRGVLTLGFTWEPPVYVAAVRAARVVEGYSWTGSLVLERVLNEGRYRSLPFVSVSLGTALEPDVLSWGAFRLADQVAEVDIDAVFPVRPCPHSRTSLGYGRALLVYQEAAERHAFEGQAWAELVARDLGKAPWPLPFPLSTTYA